MALTQISTNGIKDATIATADIAADAINSEHYTDGSIDTAHIAADQITGALIANDAVGAEHIETLDADLKFVDSAKVVLGTGDDLEIYHNGTNSYIENNTGQIQIKVDEFRLLNNAGSENMIDASADGAVKLYYDASNKAETYSNGFKINGQLQCEGDVKFDNPDTAGRDVRWDSSDDTLEFNDNTKAGFGDSLDLQIYHDGSHSLLKNTTGYLRLMAGGSGVTISNLDNSETMATFLKDGAVELYYDNVKKLNTESWGVEVIGTLRADVLNLLDSQQLKIGDGADFTLEHNGSDSTITNGTGNLRVRNAGEFQVTKSSTENMLIAKPDGAVELYYDNVKHFQTTSAGIQVISPEGTSAAIEIIADDGDDAGDNWEIRSNQDVNDLTFRNNTSGSLADILTLEKDGDLKLTGDLWCTGDSKKVQVGAGADLQIYHDGNDTYFDNNVGDFYIRNDGNSTSEKVRIQAKGGEQSILCSPNGAVDLYYDNVKKFETTAAGAQVTGASSSYALQVNSSDKVMLRLNTTDGTDQGPELSFFKNSSSIADGDQLGYIQFSGPDSNGNGTIYSAIIGHAIDVTDGTEDGQLRFYTRNNGSFQESLKIASDGTFTGSGSNDISDQRLKENITTVTNATDKIKALTGRTFTWKSEANLPAGTHYGFIAQEVESVVSDLVDNTSGIRQFDKDGNLIAQDDKGLENKDEGTTYAKSVNAVGVVPILVEALKEALTKIETLETKVAALEAE